MPDSNKIRNFWEKVKEERHENVVRLAVASGDLDLTEDSMVDYLSAPVVLGTSCKRVNPVPLAYM